MPPRVRQKAFSLLRPTDSPSFGMAILHDGVALVSVEAVHEAPAGELREEDRENLREQMQFSEASAFQEALLAQAEVVRYLDRLE